MTPAGSLPRTRHSSSSDESPAARPEAVELHVVDRGETLQFVPRRVVIAGYTGRDRGAAELHIEELAAIGVPRPEQVPDVNVFGPELFCTAPLLETTAVHTSGEAEPVIVFSGGEWFLGVGSDHTDRDLERVDMRASKGACVKPMSREVWSHETAGPRWERLVLRSFVNRGTSEPYQDGSLSYFMDRSSLVELLEARLGDDLDGHVIFCGTLPLTTGSFVYSNHYRVQLLDPVTGDSLEHQYGVELVGPTAG